ncbi:MAG TPA: DUF72 domain-containing protein [Geobacter sp.]|nr:DUF72 domain-containing protein [Geobacter sp.]
MALYVGTSGFSYPAWKGKFYPEDLPEKRMLHFYGTRFRSVEINNTFHRMPRAALLESWAAEVPPDFKFALKAPQRITHLQRLKGVDDAVSYLCDVAGTLKERLGPLLFQLPPALKKDVPLLHDFLALLPPETRAAFQFGHSSWFDDEVFGLLQRNGAALCIVDSADGVEVPRVRTAEWGYLRLRRPEYGEKELARWAELVHWQKWSDAFVFFKHEEEALGPLLAQRFLTLSGESKTEPEAI